MSKTERQQILLLERAQASAVNRGNVRAAMKMFDKGFIGFSSTQHKRIRGLGALAKTFQYYLKRTPKITYRLKQPQVQVNGGVAVATFYWEVGLGRRQRIHGRGSHVFVRRGENWRVVQSTSRVPIEIGSDPDLQHCRVRTRSKSSSSEGCV